MTWLVLGVSGATCSGKTSLARRLHALLPRSRLLHQDDCFHVDASEKHTRIASLENHVNYEILSSLDMDLYHARVEDALRSDPGPGPRPVLILEGFLVLNDPKLRDLCDLRVFLTLSHEVCWERRLTRTYDPPDVPGYFEEVVWPYYLKHHREVVESGRQVMFMDGANSLEENLSVVMQTLAAITDH